MLFNIIFKHVQHIIAMNLLTKFHEDWTINVASRVFYKPEKSPTILGIEPGTSRFQIRQTLYRVTIQASSYSKALKNAPPLGSHVFQENVTIFELIQDIIETNLLSKFHEDWAINVASRVLTRQILTPNDARRITEKRRSQKLTMSTLCSGELK
ncbi:hypothetical protein DPMN_059408 [Dreissena polymorpha]|uniref:Uncharacterized protein n=1 Tax=Dreissena polymorpha TaxID=45954 RepID=A0A9D4C3G3_DREPO|nr:hypothetical protein DPMN_059408 [Dreissena polymorpha]